jgi:hypothetical protein
MVFVLDTSESVGRENFPLITDFVSDLVIRKETTIGPNDVQVGVLIYNHFVLKQFDMNEYSDKLSLQNAINTIEYKPGSTNTGEAIQ